MVADAALDANADGADLARSVRRTSSRGSRPWDRLRPRRRRRSPRAPLRAPERRAGCRARGRPAARSDRPSAGPGRGRSPRRPRSVRMSSMLAGGQLGRAGQDVARVGVAAERQDGLVLEQQQLVADQARGPGRDEAVLQVPGIAVRPSGRATRRRSGGASGRGLVPRQRASATMPWRPTIAERAAAWVGRSPIPGGHGSPARRVAPLHRRSAARPFARPEAADVRQQASRARSVLGIARTGRRASCGRHERNAHGDSTADPPGRRRQHHQRLSGRGRRRESRSSMPGCPACGSDLLPNWRRWAARSTTSGRSC